MITVKNGIMETALVSRKKLPEASRDMPVLPVRVSMVLYEHSVVKVGSAFFRWTRLAASHDCRQGIGIKYLNAIGVVGDGGVKNFKPSGLN